MANVVFELMAVLGLYSKPFEDGLKGAESTATGGGSKIGAALGGAAKVAGAAVAAASTAVVAFSKSSVDAGMQFDTAMSQVAATMGTTVDEMTKEVGHADTAYGEFSGNLRDFAQFLGANTAFSATEAAEALNYMALAGYKTQESMDMLPSVLSLAAAGNFDLARASDMVTDAQTAFGIDAERTAQMVDEMAKAASTGNTSVEQLGDAFLVVGGLAQELNGGMVTLADGTQQPVDGLQELEIALTAMANAGVKGSEAGTHMRNMLLKLSSPTKEGVEALEALGVSVFDADGKMRSLNDIFGDLNTSLGTLTQEEKIQAISDLFNVRDMASAEALLNAVGEDWDLIGAEILEAQGAAAQMAETQLDNLAGDVTLFQSALEGAKIAISDSLTPTLRDFVQFGTEAVSELGTAFREDGLEGALNALGPVIDQGIGLIFDKLPAVLDAAVALLDALVSGIITNLPKLVPAVIQLVEKIVSSISDNLEKILDAAVEIIFALADGLVEAYPNLIPAITEMIVTIAEKLTEPDTLVHLVRAALDIIVALADGLLQAIPKLLEAVPEIIENLITALIGAIPQFVIAGYELLTALIKDGPKIILEILKFLPDLLISIVTGIIDGIPMIIDAGVELLTSIIEDLPTIISTVIKAIPEIVMGLVKALAENAGKIIESGAKLLASLAEGILEALPELLMLVPQIINGIVDGIFEGLATVYNTGKEILTSIKDGFMEGIEAAREWGSDLISNFIDGITDKVGDLWDKVKEIGQGIKDFLGFSEPKKGPLSNFHTYAPDMMALFAKGIKENENLVTAQISRSFNFEPQLRGASPALAAGPTTNTYNITVNGIDELEEVVRWYQGRQVEGRMR